MLLDDEQPKSLIAKRQRVFLWENLEENPVRGQIFVEFELLFTLRHYFALTLAEHIVL